MKLKLPRQIFGTKTEIPHFKEIRPVEAELSHTDRRTERQGEANSSFLQFCEKRLKNYNFFCVTAV